ncbi:MAG: amidohydrolase family protein [Pseudomonadota bacterium]
MVAGAHPEWLAQVEEDVLEPDLRIIDPHHHLWDYPDSRYLLDELLTDIGSGHNVVGTVFVECAAMYRADGPDALKPVGETEFVNGIAAMGASGGYGAARPAAGIVSFADLTLGASVGEVLDAHIAVTPRFKGIRHAAGWDASPEVRNSHTRPIEHLYSDKAFREGFAELDRRNLSFELWQYHPQLPEATDLARAFPNTTFILDHFGGPLGVGPYEGNRDEIFARWREDIAEMAALPNVTAKLGGLVMAVNGFGFNKREIPPTSDELVAATRPWYEHAIESFGAERCMFESNFPVDKVSTSYRVLWNSFKKIAAGCSAAEKAALFHDTAARVYRLD